MELGHMYAAVVIPEQKCGGIKGIGKNQYWRCHGYDDQLGAKMWAWQNVLRVNV